MAPPRPPVSRQPRQSSTHDSPPPSVRETPSLSAPSPSPPRSSKASARSPWVLVARLIRPHGRRGELVAEILTDFPERFHQRSRLFLIPPQRIASRPRAIQLDNFWFLRSRIVLKFQGIDSINDAEALRGFSVAIPAAERAPLAPGSVYIGDLIGCRVVDLNLDGLDLGEIVDVDRHSSSTELLVVRRPAPHNRPPHRDRELLIPFVAQYLVRIDQPNRLLEMRLPEGLLDINAPITEEEKREAASAHQRPEDKA